MARRRPIAEPPAGSGAGPAGRGLARPERHLTAGGSARWVPRAAGSGSRHGECRGRRAPADPAPAPRSLPRPRGAAGGGGAAARSRLSPARRGLRDGAQAAPGRRRADPRAGGRWPARLGGSVRPADASGGRGRARSARGPPGCAPSRPRLPWGRVAPLPPGRGAPWAAALGGGSWGCAPDTRRPSCRPWRRPAAALLGGAGPRAPPRGRPTAASPNGARVWPPPRPGAARAS